MSRSIQRINPLTMPDSASVGYSQISVVEPGRIAYISGQVASTRGSSHIPNGINEQMEIVSENALRALTSIGAKTSDIIITRIYVVNLTPQRLERLMPVFLRTFGEDMPSVTGVGVAALAHPDFKIEMELVVRVPD